MRTLFAGALLLALAGCGRDRTDASATHGAPSSTAYRGPDALLLRVPRAGGVPQVVAYSRVDSVVWQADDRLPAPERILSFDETAGAITFIDTKGRGGWLDLRLGTITIPSKDRLTAPSGSDGPSLYGVSPKGAVVRYTSSGMWTVVPPKPATAVFPQRDGSVIVIGGRGANSVAWRARPPGVALEDTLPLPEAGRALRTQLGDRIYLVGESQLSAIDTRKLSLLPSVSLDHPARALAATPSGDRVFVAFEGQSEIGILDRYRGSFTDKITLPAPAIDLRMDPVGRYLLARPESGDSAWVIALGTDRVIGTLATAWREDLPFVVSDGSVGVVQGKDVAFVDGETMQQKKRIAGGASDLWYAFQWDGFRPRAAVLDQSAPLNPDSGLNDSTLPNDSTRVDSTVRATVQPTTPTPAPAKPTGWTLQFAADLNEQTAKDRASQIKVNGQTPRVVPTVRAGQTIYRVVLGPFATQADAQKAGQASGQSYYVYEGNP